MIGLEGMMAIDPENQENERQKLEGKSKTNDHLFLTWF
jgi:hypothetical protein